jgi:arylsulfatase A-like enzyme
LLSGRYPEFVGVPGVIRTHDEENWGYLTPESILLPTLFQQNGYHTTLIGKWHLGLEKPNRPNQRGFDEFHGWLGDMMDDYWAHRRHGINYMRRNEETIDPPGHATDLFTQWSIASLRQRATSLQPWFQFLAYNAPHAPIHPPEDWLAKVTERENGITGKRARIVALIEHLDDGIGQVLQTLDALGQRDNTLVFFTSDNGGKLHYGASNGLLRSDKTHVYEGGIKVTTCARWPGHIQAGQTTDFRALTMDIVPTLADICGIPIHHDIDGRSFKQQLLEGSQIPFDHPVFHMWLQGTTKEAMRQGDWKLVRDKAGTPFELYHMKTDPYETTNLAAQEPERLNEMTRALASHMREAQRVSWRRPQAGKQ